MYRMECALWPAYVGGANSVCQARAARKKVVAHALRCVWIFRDHCASLCEELRGVEENFWSVEFYTA